MAAWYGSVCAAVKESAVKDSLAVQEFWAWMTGTQLVRASAAASLAGDAAAARALRRREETKPVTTDEVSFTVTRHNAIRSMTQAKVTASTSLAALAAVADIATLQPGDEAEAVALLGGQR